jgi:hypothetical protein
MKRTVYIVVTVDIEGSTKADIDTAIREVCKDAPRLERWVPTRGLHAFAKSRRRGRVLGQRKSKRSP